MPNGSYGYDVNGQQVTSTNSATNIWALMLGALQGILSGGGGGGGGNVTIVGTTPTGNTVATTTNVTTGNTIGPGCISIEFLLSSTFVGTINGATFDNTTPDLVVGSYRLDAPTWKPGSAVVYTISAGRAILTTQT